MPVSRSNRRADAAKQRRVAEQQAVLESLRAGQPIRGAVSANPLVAGVQNLAKALGDYTQPDLYPAQLGGRNVLVGGPGSQLMPVNVGGQTLYPMKLGGRVIYRSTSETTPQNTFLRQEDSKPEPQPEPQPKAPTTPTPLVTGLTPDGEVDRRQSDEYKATRARYDQLRKAGPEMVMTPEGLREKAVDYGLQKWSEMYPELAALQQQGSFNPLMQQTFGYQTGEGPGQLPAGMAPDQQTVMGDLGSRAQGEGGYDYEALMAERARRDMQSPDPLVKQKIQQGLTAEQADKATTAGMSGSALNRADQFLTEFDPLYTPKQIGVKFPDPSGRTPGINPNPFFTRILN